MISFLGVRTDGRTDRHGFGILTWKHVGTQKISTQNSKLVVSRRSLYASPEVGDAYDDIFSRGADRRTDRQTRFWNPHMETCRHTKNFNSKLKISG